MKYIRKGKLEKRECRTQPFLKLWAGLQQRWSTNNNEDFSYFVIGSSEKRNGTVFSKETWLLSGKFKKPDGLIELP